MRTLAGLTILCASMLAGCDRKLPTSIGDLANRLNLSGTPGRLRLVETITG